MNALPRQNGLCERWAQMGSSTPAGRTTTTLGAPVERADSGAYFLVFEENGARRFDVPLEGTVLIGRSDDAELQLLSESVSRRHSQVELSEGRARVIDLESHNGTRVNGAPIRGSQEIVSGDSVSVGEVTLVFRSTAERRDAQERAILDAQAFRARLTQELARSIEFRRPLAIAVLAASEPVPDGHERLEGLSPVDIVGRGPDHALWIICPELGSDQARGRIEFLARSRSVPTRAGMSVCPEDGCDGETLLSASQAAAAQAAPGQVALAAQTQTQLALGDRKVLVGDPAMARIYALLRRLAASDLAVLVHGETGAGKENAAFAVHTGSKRADGPFVTVNCAALPESLLESELFGHERGAFTGALQAKTGMIEAAHRGTLFLDEVGELSAAAQAKLLRVLEQKSFNRVGGTQERTADFRIVAATNRSLESAVGAGTFRQDLYFRLSAATVVIPPLRDRPREIPLLAQTFLARACTALNRAALRITPAAMNALCRYAWPGNVRELKNAMDYAAAAAVGEALEPQDLPATLGAAPKARPEGASSPVAVTLADELRGLELRRMQEALDACDGVQTRAAERLGMPLRTFVFKLRRHGLATRKRSP